MEDLHTLDVRQMLCPMPVIKTQDRVKLLKPGDELSIYCTDPGVLSDIPSWCRINGHTVVSCQENDNEIIIRIKVEMSAP